jgi:hypothetical protein
VPSPQQIILQGTEDAEFSAYSALSNVARSHKFDEAIFIAPFATKEGVRRLNAIADDAEVARIQWLVGLDGVITTPSALRAISESELTSHLRGWTQSGDQRSLHAKTYMLIARRPYRVALYIGSANATGDGLAFNIEAGVMFTLDGNDARELHAQMSAWFEALCSLPACSRLNDSDLQRYAERYQKPRFKIKRLARVVGVEAEPSTQVRPRATFTWIELAVTGGSANQIEICKAMVPFFTGRAERDSVDFELVDERTGRVYPDNGYRLRPANAGHRVEVNTELAREFDLRSASKRRDIVMFRKTNSSGRLIIELHPAKAAATQALIQQAQDQGRIRRTVHGPTGRVFYI